MFDYCLHLVVFAISFFWMIDFLVRSNISTQTGLTIIFIMYVCISLFYYFYVSSGLTMCPSCHKII